MFGVALAAVSAGVVLAVLPGTGHHHHGRAEAHTAPGSRSNVQIAASYLGLSRSALRRRLRGGATLAQIAQAVPGRSVNGLLDALIAPRAARLRRLKLSSSTERARLGQLRVRVGAAIDQRRGRESDIASAAASLRLTETALLKLLDNGQSLAQVARTTGRVSPAALIELLVGVKARRLALAERAGAISSSQGRTMRRSLSASATREVNDRLP